MNKNKRKIINDPVLGFINIPTEFLYDLVQHPYVQRLGRIKQLGLSSVVYPGAQHTRFQHSLGAMHLMGEAIAQLRQQGHDISPHEAEAARAAILLHDIGHGPFSHCLEHSLVHGISHEELSLLMMGRMNEETGGRLDLAMDVFRNRHPKRFLHQLVSGQLDMDRIDYLSRDSFYTGVVEGTIGAARIIKMLNLHEGELAVDAKGIYSIEKFLVARRLMYWQVYLHKTSVAAEKMLVNILKRAKVLAAGGADLFASPALRYFLYRRVDKEQFLASPDALRHFALLDDADIVCAIKVWQSHPDAVLRTLCTAFTNRRLFKVEVQDRPFDPQRLHDLTRTYMRRFGIGEDEAACLTGEETVSTDTYNPLDDRINILYKDGTVKDIAEASDMLNIQVLTKKVEKHYLCYYRL